MYLRHKIYSLQYCRVVLHLSLIHLNRIVRLIVNWIIIRDPVASAFILYCGSDSTVL